MSEERNIKLIVSYDGTDLFGWQRQREERTVQGDIEKALSTMIGEHVNLIGAGRTDAGVHAAAMVAHFKTRCSIPEKGFKRGLNSLLSTDIRIMNVWGVPLSFHARKDAVSKIYEYRFSFEAVPSPLESRYCAYFIEKRPFRKQEVEESLRYIEGEHDFSSFEAAGSREKKSTGRGAVRRIFSAQLFQLEGNQKKYYFRFIGDGFLRHMVRNFVGTLMEIGLGKGESSEMEKILSLHSRQAAGPTAPACGLILREVSYLSQ